MKKLKLKDVKQGMIPARDIKDRTGRVILVSGQKISEKHIKTFKAWGITEVAVQSDSSESEPLDLEDEFSQAPGELKKTLDTLFTRVDLRHPACKELYSLCLKRKINLQAKDGPDGR